MTRINAEIPAKLLCNKHLLAEHREIKRIPNTVASGKANLKDVPQEFSLGKGHVRFFYNKQKYLHSRYVQIYGECKRRGFNVQNYSAAWVTVKRLRPELWNDWTPAYEVAHLLAKRINDRLHLNDSLSPELRMLDRIADWHRLID